MKLLGGGAPGELIDLVFKKRELLEGSGCEQAWRRTSSIKL